MCLVWVTGSGYTRHARSSASVSDPPTLTPQNSHSVLCPHELPQGGLDGFRFGGTTGQTAGPCLACRCGLEGRDYWSMCVHWALTYLLSHTALHMGDGPSSLLSVRVPAPGRALPSPWLLSRNPAVVRMPPSLCPHSLSVPEPCALFTSPPSLFPALLSWWKPPAPPASTPDPASPLVSRPSFHPYSPVSSQRRERSF